MSINTVKKPNKTYSFNDSTIFLLSMLGSEKEYVDKHINTLVNVYYHSEEDLDYSNSYKNRIYIVFNINEELMKDIENISKNKYYITYSILDSLIIFTFKVRDIYINDYLLFKKGKFSKFSEGYKIKLLNSYPNKKDYIRKIIYPSQQDKNQLLIELDTKIKIDETRSIPDTNKEIFKISSFYTIKI